MMMSNQSTTNTQPPPSPIHLTIDSVANSFILNGLTYFTTMIPHTKYTPLQHAFVTADEGLSKFILSKLLMHQEGGGDKVKQLLMSCTPNPFDLALQLGHYEFTKRMYEWLKLQLEQIDQKSASSVNNNNSQNAIAATKITRVTSPRKNDAKVNAGRLKAAVMLSESYVESINDDNAAAASEDTEEDTMTADNTEIEFDSENYEYELNRRLQTDIMYRTGPSFDYNITELPNISKNVLQGNLQSSQDERRDSIIGLYEKEESGVPNHVKKCIDVVTQNFIVCEKKRMRDRSNAEIHNQQVPSHLYEIDLNDLSDDKQRLMMTESTDSTSHGLSSNLEEFNNLLGREFNHTVSRRFVLNSLEQSYPLGKLKTATATNFDPPDMLLRDFEMSYSTNYNDTDLLFTPLSVNFKVTEQLAEPIEEFLCSVTIYETGINSEFTRLSETFTFNIASPEEMSRRSRALFSLDRVHSGMTVLFKFKRLFKGEHTEALNDLYIRGDKVKEKEIGAIKLKLSKHFAQVEKMHAYFAWAAINLDQVLTMKECIIQNIISIPERPGNQPDKVYLQYFLSQEKKSYGRTIPGSIKFSFVRPENTQHVTHFISSTHQMTICTGEQIEKIPRIKSLQTDNAKFLEIENICVLHPISAIFPAKDIKHTQLVVSLREDDSDLEYPGLSVFYPLESHNLSEYCADAQTCVSLSLRNPQFSEEIRFRIPSYMNNKLHLLFKFYRLHRKEKTVLKAGHKELYAYAYVNLFDKGSLRRGSLDVDIYFVKGLQSTSFYMREPLGEKLEGGSFKFELNPRSITFPVGAEGSLGPFINCINNFPDYTTVPIEELKKGVKSITQTPSSLSVFAPMVLNQLFQIISDNPKNSEVRYIALKSIMSLVEKYRTEDPSLILIYAKYYFNFSAISEPLLQPIEMYFAEQRSEEMSILANCSWFIFAILLKSMILQYNARQVEGSYEFPNSFKSRLTDLLVRSVGSFLGKMTADHKQQNPMPIRITEGIGSFFMHTLSILPKTYVLSNAFKFYSMLNWMEQQDTAVDMQLFFFKQLFSHKSYIQLFLPKTIAEALTVVQENSTLTECLALTSSDQYAYSIYADTVVRCLCHPARLSRMRGITSLRELLYLHESDERYSLPIYKERLFQLHFEFIFKFLDVIDEWKTNCHSRKDMLTANLAHTRKQILATENSIRSRKFSLTASNEGKRSRQSADQRFMSEIDFLENTKTELMKAATKYQAEIEAERPKVKEEKRQLLACILHILLNMNTEAISTWICHETTDMSRRIAFMKLLQLILTTFEFSSSSQFKSSYTAIFAKKMTQKQEEIKPNFGWGSPAWNELSNPKYKIEAKRVEEPQKRNRSVLSKPKQLFTPRIFASVDEAPNMKQILSPLRSNSSRSQVNAESVQEQKDRFVDQMISNEKHLSSIASGYVISTIAQFIELMENENDEGDESELFSHKHFMNNVARTLLHLLHLNQTDKTLVAVLTFLRIYFTQFSKFLYSRTSGFVPLFCEALICLCNSRLAVVRSNAAASLYILIREGFNLDIDIPRIQVVVTASLSRVLQKVNPERSYLLAAFDLISALSKNDPEKPIVAESDANSLRIRPSEAKNIEHVQLLRSIEEKIQQFSKQRVENYEKDLQTLCDQLKKLLIDIISLNETLSDSDPQKTEELLDEISKTYTDIPELRFIWLRQLALFHRQQMQYAECAQCYMRILAVVFNFLTNMSSPIVANIPLQLFYNVFPQATEEKNAKKFLQAGIALQGNDFTENGVVSLIRTIVDYLELAEHYEHVIPLLQLLIPFFQRTNDFMNLSKTSSKIAIMYDSLHKFSRGSSRQYNTYYRLHFCGGRWGPLDKQQFIYKMPKLSKLHEVQRRILQIYTDAHLIASPKQVDETTLDPEKKYLQFHSVKPLQEDSLFQRNRKSSFEQNVNVSAFYYETAFYKANSSENISNLYKRRVILTVKDSFPSVTTRLPITSEEEIILTPIEAAIDNIDSQIKKLEEVIQIMPPDGDQLQLVLQGSVRASVNNGPKDIVENFLAKSERTKYDKLLVQSLNDKCQYFLFLCEHALKIDNKIAQGNKKTMHNELEKGYTETKNLFALHVKRSKKVDTIIEDFHLNEQKLMASNIIMVSETMDLSLSNHDSSVQEGSSTHKDIRSVEEMDDFMGDTGLPYNRYFIISSSLK